MRFICLYVPAFPLAALLRSQPDLHGVAVAVVEGQGARARVIAVSAQARLAGIDVGSSAAQAQARLSKLVIEAASDDRQRAAQAALCDAAESFSPRVEDARSGVVYLDADGLESLFSTESKLANAVAHRAETLGLSAQVGMAGSKVAAYLAARDGGGVAVIPPGEEWSFLAPVPVDLLQPSRELASTLRRWGISTVGQLASLPAGAVASRLGPEGARLIALARGEDQRPLVPRPLALHFEEGVDLDYGLEAIEPFLFVLRGLLDRLVTRLEVRGLVCGDLHLSMRLTTRGRDERTVAVAAPNNDIKSLLALVRLHLEAYPAPAAVEGLKVLAIPEQLRAAQLDLFRPSGPTPARLATTLARLTALCGADRVGAPAVASDHLPDGYGVREFAPEQGARFQVADAAASFGGEGAVVLALRSLRPPREVEVLCERDRPQLVRGEGVAGRVIHAAGPWRRQGSWWNGGRYARDYYDTQLSDGAVYRIYRELYSKKWYLEGAYD